MKNDKNQSKWIKGRGYTKKILLRNIKGKIRNIQQNRFPKGTVVSLHYHQKGSEIFYILKGKAIFIVGKKKIKTKPGMIIDCPAKTIHGVVNDAKETAEILIFKIYPHERDTYWV